MELLDFKASKPVVALFEQRFALWHEIIPCFESSYDVSANNLEIPGLDQNKAACQMLVLTDLCVFGSSAKIPEFSPFTQAVSLVDRVDKYIHKPCSANVKFSLAL